MVKNLQKLVSIKIKIKKMIGSWDWVNSKVSDIAKKNKGTKIVNENKGAIFSLDLLFSMLLLIIIIATVSYSLNILIESNNNVYEDFNLEKIGQDTVDTLIKTTGTPENWETLFSYSNSQVKVGLATTGDTDSNSGGGTSINGDANIENAFRREGEKNTISLAKIDKLKNNYNTLIGDKQLYGLIKSSMEIYPINKELKPIIVKDEGIDSLNVGNIININRTVNIDYLSNYVLLKFQNKDNEDDNENSNINKDYLAEKGTYGTGLCNHQSIIGSSHISETSNIGETWICKTFTIERVDIERYKYYLFFNKNIINSNSYWILDDNAELNGNNNDDNNNNRNSISSDYKDISNYISEKVEGNLEKTFWLHLQYPNSLSKDNTSAYETYLIAIPKDTSVGDLTIENFKIQPAYFVMKFWK
ncbi:MAG: hypothetical protein ACRCVG_06840 [Methanobacteriaceae archaeon]